MAHEVGIMHGVEYKGETYIDCRCGDTFEGDSLAELLAFLREHEAIT